MANDLKAILDRITAKTGILVEKYKMLEAAKAKVDEENKELKAEIEKLKAQLHQANTDAEYLRVVHSIAATSPQDIAKSKAILSQLVRDVDKCIAQLTD